MVALPASYVLARFDFAGKKFFNGLFMAGLFVNVNYIVLPIFLMLFNADIKLGFDFFLIVSSGFLSCMRQRPYLSQSIC